MTPSATRSIGVLTGGGDSSGINAALRTVARCCHQAGVRAVGIRNGWAGLVCNDTSALDLAVTANRLNTGGTLLGTSRTNPFSTDDSAARLAATVRAHGLDSLIVLGGDDTLGVAHRVGQALGISVAGIAQSIDNDIAETDYCIGFDTAVSRVADAVANVRTTCLSHDQDIVVEVMGRETGWIAAAAGIATEAEYCVIPELPCSLPAIAASMLARRRAGCAPAVVLVAEGCRLSGGRLEDRTDDFGHPYLAGSAYPVRAGLQDLTGLTIRALVLGYLQRGGPPTSYEVQMAVRLGHEAAKRVLSGCAAGSETRHELIAVRGSDIAPVNLGLVTGRKRYLTGELLTIAQQTWYG